MTEDEFKTEMLQPIDSPRLYLMESTDPDQIQFAFIARFPPGTRVVRIYQDVPSYKFVIDPDLAIEFAGKVRARLMLHKHQGDADLVNWTNWVSLAAAIEGMIQQFNREQAKRHMAAVPMAFNVGAAIKH